MAAMKLVVKECVGFLIDPMQCELPVDFRSQDIDHLLLELILRSVMVIFSASAKS